MEKLIIRNFLGISQIELELSSINILIGSQATGKSICAKLCYFFKGFVQELLNSVEDARTKREIDSSYRKKFERYFPSQTWGKAKFKVRYEINGFYIEVSRDDPSKTTIKLKYSEIFKKELNRLRRLFKQNLNRLENEYEDEYYDTSRAFYNARINSEFHLQKHIDPIVTNSQLFIPAGRSFFANLQSSIFSFLSSNKAIDPFLTEFGKFYENIKRYPLKRRTRDDKRRSLLASIDDLIEEILRGRHVTERGKDFLISSDSRRTNIANASSGQQEMLPLALILRMLPFIRPFRSGYTTYIEEPEAHLFPSAQRIIVELMALIFNNTDSRLQLFITTHSPYILTSFNNLIHAGFIHSKIPDSKKEKLYEIIPKDRLLTLDNIKAYSLSDGKSIEIKCDDCGLITAEILDSVSDDLSTQFDNLMSLEQ